MEGHQETNGNWEENRKLILHLLKDMEIQLREVQHSVTSIKEQLATLTVKTSLWASFLGIIGGLLGFIISFATRLL